MNGVRATVHYRGQVQGVGFRRRACSAVASHAVTGTVRNLADGRVELVAEGARDEVEAALRTVAARLAAHIDEASVAWSEATGEFRGFDIVRRT